jgi:hypothetical protein
MKTRNPIYLLFFLCLASQIRAQLNYERTYPHTFISNQVPIELSDTSTFSLRNNGECGSLRSMHIDVNGSERIENIFYGEAFSSGQYWIGHDSVLIWVEAGAYDVGPDSLRVYVWTPNEINKILSIGLDYNFSPTRRYGAFLYSPDRVVYEKSDTLYTKDLSNNLLEDSLIIPQISLILEFEKSILVFSENESPLLLNDQLEDIKEWQNFTTLPFSLYEAVVLDSFLVGVEELNPLSLAKINVYDESLTHLDLTSYFDLIEDVQSNKDNLFIKGISNGIHQVLQLDSKFSLVDLTVISFPDLVKQLAFHYYPDRVYASGHDGIANYKADYRMCYKYTVASPIKYVDIALDTMWVDSVYQYPMHFHIPPRVYVSAVIRNHTLEPLHFFTLHFEEEAGFFCASDVNPYHFADLSILAGEVDTVSFQVWSRPLGYGMPMITRFYASHGNHHLESDASNNDFELFYLISSTEVPVSLPVSIYPNPFIDFLAVTEFAYSVKLDLYDHTGRQIATGLDRLENLNKLPAGIYFLQIISGQSIAVKRVVKVK